MKNRIKSYINSSEIPQLISKPLSLATTNLESLFDGPKTFEILIREEIERARSAGQKAAIEKIHAQVKKHLEKYISKIIKTSYLVKRISVKLLPDLKIIQSRTNFYFNSPSISLFFIINTTLEDEMSFSNLLNKIEQEILKEDNFIVETFFINEHNKEIDSTAIKSEFPFSVAPPKNKD